MVRGTISRIAEPIENRPQLKFVLEDVLIYSIALGLIAWAMQGVSLSKVLHDLRASNLVLFVPVTLCAFAVWFFGENYMFAVLFTFFHKKTTYRETLPATAAMYFLQAINSLVADAALVVFLHNRKQASWGAAAVTIAYVGFIDLLVMTSMAIAAAIAVPHSPMRELLPYVSLALAAGIAIALWMRWRRNPTYWERAILEHPSVKTFRDARFKHYAVLYLIRLAIFVPEGFLVYLEAIAFHLRVPMAPLLALTPAIVAVSAAPVAPNGLGLAQTVMVWGLAPYATATQAVAMSLSVNVIHLLCRILLGLTSARHFARRIIRAGSEPGREHRQHHTGGSRRPHPQPG